MPASQHWQFSAAAMPISVSGGSISPGADDTLLEENEAGLKLVLLLEGTLRYSTTRARRVQVSGPAVHLTLSHVPYTVAHDVEAGTPLRFVAVRIPRAEIRQQFDLPTLAAGPPGHPRADAPFFLDRPADRRLQALGRQLLLSPLHGDLRQIYLAGKALELTACVLAACNLTPAAPALAAPAALGPRQIEALQHARALLLATLQSPPELAELARQVGLNVTTLTRGFRQLFGTSVYGFVREQRLEQAYLQLAAGSCTVAQAAYASGYSDSHFSKAFHKRFGVMPRALRP